MIEATARKSRAHYDPADISHFGLLTQTHQRRGGALLSYMHTKAINE